MKKIILSTVAFCFLIGSTGRSVEFKKPGLVGAWFGEADLTDCRDAMLIKNLEQKWDESDDHGRVWSAKWQGFVVGPATGEITLHAETDKSVTVEIGGKKIVNLKDKQKQQAGTTIMTMTKDREYPITVTYIHDDGGFDGYLRVKWSWAGHKVPSPVDNLRHTVEQERHWKWQPEPISDIDTGSFVTIPVKNVFVYQAPGRFAGWPANNGVWSWGNEILVGFSQGYYKANKSGHSIDRDKPRSNVLGRSLDGGETWKVEDPDNFVGDGGKAVPCPGNINFAHPDFAMRCREDEFYISYDRGKNWQGPYQLADFGTDRLTSRTDYIINGKNDCMFFLSAKEKRVQAGLQDRAFCARTTDGGKTFKFLSWMTHNIEVRSVMPSTVRISENQLVSAMRRRYDPRRPGSPDTKRNWIDVYRSDDNGKTWKFLSKVANTDTGKRNGNPPSMVKLKDGRLCVTYGYRGTPYGIRAKLSSDNGRTWGPEIHLRDDGRTWDLGYTRTVQRLDGKLVTIYYYTTEVNEEQHIAATIWEGSQNAKNSVLGPGPRPR